MQALVQDKMVDQEEQLDKQVLIMQVKELFVFLVEVIMVDQIKYKF